MITTSTASGCASLPRSGELREPSWWETSALHQLVGGCQSDRVYPQFGYNSCGFAASNPASIDTRLASCLKFGIGFNLVASIKQQQRHENEAGGYCLADVSCGGDRTPSPVSAFPFAGIRFTFWRWVASVASYWLFQRVIIFTEDGYYISDGWHAPSWIDWPQLRTVSSQTLSHCVMNSHWFKLASNTDFVMFHLYDIGFRIGFHISRASDETRQLISYCYHHFRFHTFSLIFLSLDWIGRNSWFWGSTLGNLEWEWELFDRFKYHIIWAMAARFSI